MGDHFVSLDDRFHILQHKLQETEIPVNDPKVKDLAKYFFGEDFANFETFSKIQNYQGSLSSLVTEMSSREITERTIIKFCKTLLKIEKQSSHSHELTPTQKPQEKPVPLVFLCDIDTPDHNTAILDDFNAAVDGQCPIVTSRDILKCTNLRDKNLFWHNPSNRDEAMKELGNKYDIYTNGAYLVFVPKKLEGGTRLLDLNLESLKKITLEEAWEQTDDKPSFEGFQRLFSPDPNHAKLVYIAGHGVVGSPAALTGEHYQQFLGWAEGQKCQGLIISSCYSGGESTLLHLADKESENPQRRVPFPVFVRSVGDFPTTAGQEAEMNVGDFMEKIGNLINAPGGQSIARLKKLVRGEEEGKEKKEYVNLLQVYFPHSGDSPGGFRTVGEGGESTSLTYREYRKRQIEDGEIKVSNQSFLEIFPGIVECPIELIGKNPIFLSMIPGKAHHLMTQVTLDGISPQEFLTENCQSYGTAHIGVTKSFFISHLKNFSGDELHQVFLNLKTGAAGFREGDSYYLWNALNNNGPLKVSPFQYLLSWKEAVIESTPKNEAVRRASAGQQSEQAVLENLGETLFWGNQQEIYDQYHAILEKPTVESLKSMNLTESDIISFIAYLLPKNEELATTLFQNGNFSPDSKDALGIPLLIIATQRNCPAFAELLLKKGADPNLPHPITLERNLGIAILKQDEKLVDIFLNHDSIDLEEVKHTFISADSKILEKCLKKGSHLDLNVEWADRDTMEPYTLLGHAVYHNSLESVKLLLEAGADPNYPKGKYSPLTEAIIANDEKKIDLLLQWNANPFQKNEGGSCPIVEAMSRSSVHIVEKLWQSFDEKTQNLTDEEKMALLSEIFIAALESGESAKLKLVLPKNPQLSDSSDYEAILKGIGRLDLFGQDDLIKEKLIPLLNSSWNLSELIEQTIRQTSLSLPVASEIIQKAIDLKADINKRSRSEFFGYKLVPLEIAFKTGNFDLARVLMDKGADPLLAADSFLRATPDNLELIKYACKKGLLRETEGKPPFLLQVARNLHFEEAGNLFKALVEEGADMNASHAGETPFSKIVSSGDKKLYDFCFQHNADLTKIDLDKLLTAAIRSQPIDWDLIVRDLVSKGSDLNAPFPDGQACTLFSCIVERGSKDLVTWCIDQGAELNPENPHFKIQPLHAAAIRTDGNSRDVFQYLVEKGALLNQKGYQNVIPTIAVITKGDLDLLQFCFDQGAILDKDMVKAAFMGALGSGNPEIVTELIKRGYQLSELSENDMEELLFYTYLQTSGGVHALEKIFALKPSPEGLKRGAKILQESIIRRGDLKTMQLFESAGVNFDTAKIMDSNSLFSASPPSELSKELLGRLEKGALKEFLNKNLGEFSSEWLQYAFANGADPNTDVDTLPLIFEVVKRKNPEQVRTVLAADPDLTKTHDKKTILEYAVEQGNQEIVELIKEANLRKK